MNPPLVSVVIPTYDRKKQLLRLLKSIDRSSYKKTEIIVIDDNSNDGTSSFVQSNFKTKRPFKIIRNKKNKFAAGSRNVGLKNVKGKYILFIDDDNEIAKGMISELVKVMESDSKIGEVGPVNYSLANKKKILWSQTNRNMSTSKTNQLRDTKSFGKKSTWESDDILNSYMVRTKVLIENRISFREEYGIMYEESDLAYRIREAGYKVVVVKDAKIYHDIEKYKNGKLISDYMDHFMTDTRRPFVTARNRIIFHSRFSSRKQFVSIVFFWMWIFAAYYSKLILTYQTEVKYSLLHRLNLVRGYFQGIISGLFFVIRQN